MKLRLEADRRAMSVAAAEHAASSLRRVISQSGKARVVAATGASQLDFLEALTALTGIEWTRVELFHLDEYVGIPDTHPASFRRYLHDHLIDKTSIRTYHFLDGTGHVEDVMRDVGRELSRAPIDIMFAGIGENGHLAFNDPPADFETTDPYILVNLDEACRQQQVGEGWFTRIEDVPTTAISMSIRQMMKANELLVIVPDARKALAVKASVEGDITPLVPASIIRTHPNVTLFLDQPAASRLQSETVRQLMAGS
ncbi:MAG TPA: glucosamine-6-phosphate deaminase [Vicinamibacterales bacterium]|nr:glucosamine-6-phosphate deaminase [Vicinamibacterales bacterium]